MKLRDIRIQQYAGDFLKLQYQPWKKWDKLKREAWEQCYHKYHKRRKNLRIGFQIAYVRFDEIRWLREIPMLHKPAPSRASPCVQSKEIHRRALPSILGVKFGEY